MGELVVSSEVTSPATHQFSFQLELVIAISFTRWLSLGWTRLRSCRWSNLFWSGWKLRSTLGLISAQRWKLVPVNRLINSTLADNQLLFNSGGGFDWKMCNVGGILIPFQGFWNFIGWISIVRSCRAQCGSLRALPRACEPYRSLLRVGCLGRKFSWKD